MTLAWSCLNIGFELSGRKLWFPVGIFVASLLHVSRAAETPGIMWATTSIVLAQFLTVMFLQGESSWEGHGSLIR